MNFPSLICLCSAMACSEPDFTVLEAEERQGYKCYLIEYDTASASDADSGCRFCGAGAVSHGPGDWRRDMVQSYLLVPDGASSSDRRPGLVLLHDHGARFDIGKEKLVRPLDSAPLHIRNSSREFVRANFDGVYFADSLASMGYVVIVPDMLYWGSRSTEACQEWSRLKFGEDGESLFCGDCSMSGPLQQDKKKAAVDSLKEAVYEGQRAVYDSLASSGIIWAEKTMKEDALAARILAGLDFVDFENIAVFGWSMGAHRAWLLTAFCPEIKTGAAVSWMTLKEAEKEPCKASDYALLIPGLRDRYDFPDIAARLAPRPFLFLSGTGDGLFPAYAVEKAFSRMQAIYRETGAAGQLRTEFFDGGHHCGKDVQGRVVEFFEKTVPLHNVSKAN